MLVGVFEEPARLRQCLATAAQAIPSGQQALTLINPGEQVKLQGDPQRHVCLSLRPGSPVTTPVERSEVSAFRIMKHQPSLTDHMRCTAEGACVPAEARRTGMDVPAT